MKNAEYISGFFTGLGMMGMIISDVFAIRNHRDNRS